MRLPLPATLFSTDGSVSLRLRLWTAWDKTCDSFERTFGPLWFAYHNAKVLRDFEWRMCRVIEEASGGVMSKPYYEMDAMIAAISQARSVEWDDGYAEGRKDAFQAMGLEDPEALED